MRNWTMAIVSMALAITASGCNGTVTKDDGSSGDMAERSADAKSVATRSYAFKGFTGVELAGPDDITVRRGDSFSITARGPKDRLDELEIKVEGDMLSVARKPKSRSFSIGNFDRDGVTIAITMPKLAKLQLTGSGEIDADTVDSDEAEAVLTGSGDLKIGKLTAKSAKISVSGSGEVEIAGGTVGSGDYSLTGSGDIDASRLAATTLDVSITGSGDIEAQASGAADITILGKGDAVITGGAKCKTNAPGSGTGTSR